MSDTEPLMWRRSGTTIVPENDVARAAVQDLFEGVTYIASWPFKGKRNIKQLRAWWSLCHIMHEHDLFPTAQAAHIALKIACGHVDMHVMPDTGECIIVPRSIAFESLSQADWRPIFRAALRVIVERWMPGVTIKELFDEAKARSGVEE